MKNVKRLGVVVAFTILTVLAYSSVASADKFTSPSGTVYTSKIGASSEGAISIHGPFVTIECKQSIFEGKVESHGVFQDVAGALSSLTYTECNFPTKVVKKGSFAVNETSGGSGEFKSTGAEVTAETSLGTCVWTTSETLMGTLTGSNTSNATIDTESSEVPRTSGSFLCGSIAFFTGSYKVTTPSTLVAD